MANPFEPPDLFKPIYEILTSLLRNIPMAHAALLANDHLYRAHEHVRDALLLLCQMDLTNRQEWSDLLCVADKLAELVSETRAPGLVSHWKVDLCNRSVVASVPAGA